MDIEKRRKLFQNPDQSYRGKPFWSWNGSLKKEELVRQIDFMKEMGFGGFFMHSRTGLETEYLGEEWFELCNECADYGDGAGMEAWLYDEDRWPSGSAGGIVTEEKEYRAKFLEMRQFNAKEYPYYRWSDKTAAVFACRLEGIYYADARRIRQEDPVDDSETVLVFEIRNSECKDVYNGYAYLDTMNRDGTDKYIEVTHKAYKEHCKDRIGTKIRGIFTDEPHRGAMFSGFSEGREYAVPFNPQLFQEFSKRFGYFLEEHLLDLFLRKKDQPLSKVSADYIEICQELFLKNFAMPIQRWCHENQMIFTGHVLHEDSLSAQTVMQGSLMRFYEYMDYPGIDVLTESNECWWIVKQVESVARQLNKEKVLSEMYGGTGWQMSFESYKHVGDWQALWGVNLRCPHLSWYTMKGEAKRDYPASILHQSGWYREYAYLENYFSRIHVMLSEGTPDCELLVLNPIVSVWARSYSTAFDGLEARDEGIKAIEQRYQDTFRMLVRHRIEFDYGEEDIMKRHGYVRDGHLYVGRCAYRKVLITGLDTISSATLDLLEAFALQGGTVIFAGDVPRYVDVCRSNAAQIMAAKVLQIPFMEEAVVSACKSGNEIEVTGVGSSDIFARVRTDGEQRIIMLLNISRKDARVNLRICLGNGKEVWRFDLRTGGIYCEDSYIHQGKIYIDADFAEGEEKMYVISAQKNISPANMRDVWESDSPQKSAYQKKNRIICPDKMKYRLPEDNIYVIDHVKVTLGSGMQIKSQEVLWADRALRDILNFPYRGGEMLQPWYEKKYGQDLRKIMHKIQLEYIFFVKDIPENISLAVEDLEHITEIRINGHTITKDSTDKWIDICFDKIQVPNYLLVQGKNKIQIFQYYDKSCGLEAVYLLGDFGVYPNRTGDMVISEMQEFLEFGDITTQGLPFYSGRITYLLEGLEGKRLLAEELEFEGAYLKLIGKQEVMVAFAPYRGVAEDLREMEIGLTRRNTFGPLHRLPAKAFAYGPETFMTTGEEWQDAPVLCAQGLMKMPAIYEVE